ncbi:MAG: peptidase C69 [Bacteroidetes bacterium GWA2_30_7]|nr:MAG: peptidase C69 [Bacteroidetes bacterium GWA2_30_7]
MKLIYSFFTLVLITLIYGEKINACTNILVTKGASTDGSCMITYAADSHTLYGELYFKPSADYPVGTMFDVYEWDTGKFMGKIKQVPHTYSVVGNMNEHQLAIGETTYGGRHELEDSTAIIDYGSLIYLTLQRAKNAREAIKTFYELTTEYGYYSSGESFSISDANEVWILEMIGKGPGIKGAVWVARRIPDGYISGHANHPRITTFPLDNGKTSISTKNIKKIFDPTIECVYTEDVITFAKAKNYFTGKDAEFSFSDTYAPLDFGGARFCEARVWAVFNRVNKDMSKYTDYAKGENLKNRMPLWVKPDNKLSVHDVMELMRDYFQGTELDMSKDLGAGPYSCIVRWRPLTWKVGEKEYVNERAISTQQTGFSFVAQSRPTLPDPIGGIFWFGVDDSYSTVYTPMYCGITKVPNCYAEGNGSIMEFSETSAFWIFNQVSNFAYTRYSYMIPDIQKVQKELESKYIIDVVEIDKKAAEIYKTDKSKALEILTDYSLGQGKNTFDTWKLLYHNLFTKFMDGNIKTKIEAKAGYKYTMPKVEQPGYGEEWYKRIASETGEKLMMKGETGH